jgi:GT2 family glycosyltransferase
MTSDLYSGTFPCSVSVVVPTYCRPGPLVECVRSLVEGSRRPDEIIVVGREDDTATTEALAQAQQLCVGKTAIRAGWVTEPGHVPPVQKGLDLAIGDLVAFVDDDVTVTTGWLGHLLSPFAGPSVGVVGGRVITPAAGPPRLKGKPGRISWYGKHWGNVASLQGFSPIEVQAVMEGNSAWRRELLTSLKFDPVLNFDDASMYGLDLCLQAASRGYRVLYEPRALVFHHAVPRTPELDRTDRPRRVFSYARNYTYIMLRRLPWWRRPIFLAWWFLIGERGGWGLGAAMVEILTGNFPHPRQLWSSLSGKVVGILLTGSGAGVHRA